MEATKQIPLKSFMVTIPKIDQKKFVGVMKALGWSTESADEYIYTREALAERIRQAEKELIDGESVMMKDDESSEDFLNRLLCHTV